MTARLVALGGGALPPALVEECVSFAKSASAPNAPCHVLVCPLASARPDAAERVSESLFASLHARRQVTLSVLELRDFDSRSESEFNWDDASRARARTQAWENETTWRPLVEQAHLLFFTGGDQNVLLDVLEGSPLLKLISTRWSMGRLTIVGTSAGMQVMSEVALSGSFLDAARAFTKTSTDGEEVRLLTAGTGLVKTRAGFGWVKGVLFDQHFLARQRQNRLLSAVLDHPQLLGIGVDEETGLFLEGEPGGVAQARVHGARAIQYFDARQASFAQPQSHGHRRAEGDTRGPFLGIETGLASAGSRLPFSLTLAPLPDGNNGQPFPRAD